MAYAERTTVTIEKSKTAIEKLLDKYGAEEFMYATKESMAGIMFRANGRQIRFLLRLPKIDEFAISPGGKRRNSSSQREAYYQERRRLWRALLLCLKAKLETIESGISTFDDEFMAHIVLPDGSTVGEYMQPQIATAYERGTMPKMLPMLEG